MELKEQPREATLRLTFKLTGKPGSYRIDEARKRGLPGFSG